MDLVEEEATEYSMYDSQGENAKVRRTKGENKVSGPKENRKKKGNAINLQSRRSGNAVGEKMKTSLTRLPDTKAAKVAYLRMDRKGAGEEQAPACFLTEKKETRAGKT